MHPKIILIHPPLTKPSEPPAGIAKLSSCLAANGIEHCVIDANLESIIYLLKDSSNNSKSADRWTRRACKKMDSNLAALQNIDTYQSKSRYQRLVADINHLLNVAGKSWCVDLSITDYRDSCRSPVKSADLLSAAEKPQANPFYPYFQHRLKNALEENPDFIGFSLNYLSQALCTFAMIGFIKKIVPRQKIILGGSLITSWVKLDAHNNIFQGLVDEMIAGPGEEKLLKLLGAKEGFNNSPPDYSGFPINQYLSPGLILPYSSAHGCYWHNCAFCPEKAEGNTYSPLGSSQVTQELQALTRQINPSLIHILDSSISPSLLKALSQSPPGAPWYGFTRITEHLSDADFCLSLKHSGCAMLKVGIESGDQEVLDQLSKGIDLPTASVALKALKKAGIATYCYFLFGTPPENEESAGKTLDFVCRHSDFINFLNLAIFNLPVLSEDAQSLKTRGFYEGDLSLYRDFEHPLGWHRLLVRKFLEKTFKKNPAVAKILQRTPDYFTSNHAPYFVLKKTINYPPL